MTLPSGEVDLRRSRYVSSNGVLHDEVLSGLSGA